MSPAPPAIPPPLEDFSLENLKRLYSKGIPCPLDFSFPSKVIDYWASVQPRETAIWWVSHDYKHERKVSYEELKEESLRSAKLFREKGLRKGDKCARTLFPFRCGRLLTARLDRNIGS